MTKLRVGVALGAALGTLAFAQGAQAAATLVVDDDLVDCPAARFQSIQNAIYAAAKGDTITICPGRYVEGSGSVGSNALLIIDDVTIRGAGADLVRIVPRKQSASGSQIAENTPNIRNNLGAIVMIDGNSEDRESNASKTHLTRVDISGVTVDGDGVYAEAGIVFRDAVGSVTRSRITNIVTTERSLDNPRPGEYKGSPDGFGIAQVTAPGGVFPTVARQIHVVNSRVDRYNSAGVLVDAATGDTPPLTASGIVNIANLRANQIIGRTLCTTYLSNGNCQQPAPLPATNGPLYGQDGVRITAGSIGNLINNTISQNLIQGTGSAVRGSATNNETLWMAAGVRLLGAGLTTISQNNIVNNSYGVFNAGLDGTTPNTAVPANAENNWWGLRASGNPTNTGPAISPTTNPPVPENPVNGAAIADGEGTTSDAVDFFPFRNGYQSDPDSGEFPVIDAPLPINDAAPTVSLTTDAATYHRGDKVTLTAAPDDDIGVHRVVFYDGAFIVGAATRPPYSASYHLPADAGCTSRTVAAVAEDSAGQTASATRTITVDCATPTPTPTATATATPTATAVATATATVVVEGEVTPSPEPAPQAVVAEAPTISLGSVPSRLTASGFQITVSALAGSGVKQLDVYLGVRKVCSITRPPFTCRVLPTGAEVGRQSLRVVVTDLNGASASTSRQVTVARFRPAGATINVSSRNLSGNRIRATIAGKVKLPARVTRADGCRGGSVGIVLKRASRVLDDSQVKLRSDCSFKKHVTTNRTGLALTVQARFRGNPVLQPTSKSRRFK